VRSQVPEPLLLALEDDDEAWGVGVVQRPSFTWVQTWSSVCPDKSCAAWSQVAGAPIGHSAPLQPHSRSIAWPRMRKPQFGYTSWSIARVGQRLIALQRVAPVVDSAPQPAP
jgi:hypothetical protein